jgi:hypothetical protein
MREPLMTIGKVAEWRGVLQRARVTIVYRPPVVAPSVPVGPDSVNGKPLPAPFAPE